MAQQAQVLAKGAGTTNQEQGSVVPVQGKPMVSVTYRLFAADHTAALQQQARRGDSQKLTGLPILLGEVKGASLTPFEDRIRRAPGPTTVTGKLSNGTFFPLAADELGKYKAAKARQTDKNLGAEAKAAARKSFESAYSDVREGIGMHVIPLSRKVAPGTVVGLCINVDCKKKYRRHPLWQVTAGDHDIVVDVFETYGKHDLDDKARLGETREEGSKDAPRKVDYHKAQLSGDVWMRSTIPFTEADVDAVADTPDVVKQALKKIYRAEFESQGADFHVQIERKKDAQDATQVQLYWLAAENGNCTSNIKALNLRADVPKRIHPAAYAAVAKAAFEAGVTVVKFTNSWRPMLGSMAHRTGRGLDLKWLGTSDTTYWLNRDGLRRVAAADKNKDGAVDAYKHGNMSVEEQQAYNEWQDAKAAASDADASHKRAIADLQAKQARLAAAKKVGNPETVQAAEAAVKEAEARAERAAAAKERASGNATLAQKSWEDQVSAHEPGPVGRYRRYLMHEPIVTQLLDPWYVDTNTHDKIEPKPNTQAKDGIQDLHRHHLHITIDDPELA